MRPRRLLAAAAASATLITSLVIATTTTTAEAKDSVAKKLAKGTYRPAVLQTGGVTRTMPAISAGLAQAAADEMRAEEADAAGGSDTSLSGPTSPGTSPGTLGCSNRDSKGNVRVNQDCTYRRQAETEITYNPTDNNNLLAGQNDSRVGYNQCGIDYSVDNGKHWGDLLPPFRQKENNPFAERPTPADPNSHTIRGDAGTAHTYDAGSDPTVAFDSKGNGYFSCVAFDVHSDASLLYVTQSPAAAKGSFFFNITPNDRRWVVAEDNTPEIFHDKQFISADRNPASPNHDNVYVTWTVFRFGTSCGPGGTPDGDTNYCESPIFGAMSTDGGRHFSTPELVSGTSDSLCFVGNSFDRSTPANSCNFDQGSDNIVLPNGDLQVIFNNGNTAPGNPDGQQLGVHCKPTGSSAAGTAHLNCASPSKVGKDVIAGEPSCNFGRGPEECIPGAYIRTNDFPRINNTNAQNGQLYATWQDYRNGEFDIQLSQSLDGGLTWKEAGTVNPDRGLDHYFPAIDLAPDGKPGDADGPREAKDRVGDSYYRTARIPNENKGPGSGFRSCNAAQRGKPAACEAGTGLQDSDYVLAGGSGAMTPYNFKVVSPVFPPSDGNQTGFNGDYSGLTINKGADAHPIWSDTRNVNPFPENGVVHDEDVFTDNVGLPDGQSKPSTGKIGKG